MSERLEPGHFYLTGSSDDKIAYCLFMDFKGDIVRFVHFPFDGGYGIESGSCLYFSEELREAQEIPTPQIVWVYSLQNLITDNSSGSVFSLMLFPSGVPEKFKETIYSLEDVQRLLENRNRISLQGIGTFVKTSKGVSCFTDGFSEKLCGLCWNFFRPYGLLAEFGLTPEGVERFLKEGQFGSWEDTEYKPGFYEFHGVITYLPKYPQYIVTQLYLPRFILDDESGCYVYDNLSPASPCNLMNYMTEMHIGVRLCPYVISNSCRGMLILSETFGSCEELMGDKVIWTEEDLMGDIDDLLHQNYKVEIPSFRMQFFAKEGKAHIQSAQMTDWISIPEMRDMFLRQKSDF